uniref:Uncharacterized protein n=1 Tax=Arundo donax TaxID=35708 RepID=A0A0A9ATB5_ARUDO
MPPLLNLHYSESMQ